MEHTKALQYNMERSSPDGDLVFANTDESIHMEQAVNNLTVAGQDADSEGQVHAQATNNFSIAGQQDTEASLQLQLQPSKLASVETGDHASSSMSTQHVGGHIQQIVDDQISLQIPAVDFPKFLQLPTEIRLMIWADAILDPRRLVDIRGLSLKHGIFQGPDGPEDVLCGSVYSPTPVPGLLGVNVEAREEFKKYNPKRNSTRFPPMIFGDGRALRAGRIHFNYETDIAFFSSASLTRTSSFKLLANQAIRNLRQIAITLTENNLSEFLDIKTRFIRLEKIYLIIQYDEEEASSLTTWSTSHDGPSAFSNAKDAIINGQRYPRKPPNIVLLTPQVYDKAAMKWKEDLIKNIINLHYSMERYDSCWVPLEGCRIVLPKEDGFDKDKVAKLGREVMLELAAQNYVNQMYLNPGLDTESTTIIATAKANGQGRQRIFEERLKRAKEHDDSLHVRSREGLEQEGLKSVRSDGDGEGVEEPCSAKKARKL